MKKAFRLWKAGVLGWGWGWGWGWRGIGTDYQKSRSLVRELGLASSSKYSGRSHTCGELCGADEGRKVRLMGWLTFKRYGGMFLVIRDPYGRTQAVIPNHESELIKIAEQAPLESVLEISGTVVSRPLKQQRSDSVTGTVEVVIDELTVLNPASKLPLSSHKNILEAEEDLRMTYRYLDIRTEPLQNRLRFRAGMISRMREFLNSNSFLDVETPTLIRSSPGGAREFMVPTHSKGSFYSLAQSPQILKQLLMVGGTDRYYQIARCYRDEKAKPDRQPEFTQLDIELSFTTREQVMDLIQDLLRFALNLEEEEPFQVMDYEKAVSKYGTDKPDTGGFVWVINFPLFEPKSDGTLESVHHPFTKPVVEAELFKDPLQAVGLSYDLVFKGNEIGGGSIRIHDSKVQRHIFEKILKLGTGDIEYLLKALDSGCPPHGGFAIGIDRLVMLLTGAGSIRDVMAFPKSSEGKDLLSGAPCEISKSAKEYYNLN